jgi:hypothetical protein
MSNDRSAPAAPRRVSPWPDGPDRALGLFPIVTVGISTKDHGIDCSINSAADTDLTPARRAEVAAELEMLVRHFKGPATLPRPRDPAPA